MKKFILPLVLTFSVVLTGCANIKSMRVNAQMKSAQKYLLEEDYEKAIVKLEKAISIDPKNVDAYILLAKAYQEADMQEEAEEIIDKIRDINGVRFSSIQEEKVSVLDSKRIYSEILNNFYKTGIIGDVDELYWLDNVNEVSSLDDDSTLYYYHFTLEDVTGDGKDEIIIRRDYKKSYDVVFIYEVIKGRAVNIGHIDSYGILTDNNLLVKSFVNSETKEEKTQVFGYYASIAEFLTLDKDKHSKEIDEAKEMVANNKIKLKFDDIVTPLNPENIKEAVDKMSLQDIDSIDEEDKSSDNEESTITNNKRKKKDKEVYEKWRSNYFKINEEDHGRFELMDITGDNRDELIVKLGDDGDSYSCVIFGTLGNEIYVLASGHSDDFRMFEDNSILFVSENMDNSKKFEYYKYDRDIRRFYMEKAGQYREGDLEYLDKLLEKKVKLTGDDIDTELTKENLDVAFGD